MPVIAATSPSRDGRITTPSASIPAGARPSGCDDANWSAIEESGHVVYDLRVGTAVVFLRDVADMRGQDYVRHGAQRMVYRQRLFIVDVEPGIGEASLL